MSVETQSLDQSEGDERRDASARRVPFDGLVEVGSDLGQAFEAQALNVSTGGIHLRTAYLPEVGQPLTCRFEAGGREVLAPGAVVWRHEESRGGEFAVRFGELDQESREALALAVDPEPASTPKDPGARVRLHIDGLGSPMRARVKGASHAELTVGSDLGFLQVGKQLELEDASTGSKRPAYIDKVLVEVDPESKIPQLVVTLRYSDSDTPSDAQEPAQRVAEDPPPRSSVASLKAGEAPEPRDTKDEDRGGTVEDPDAADAMPASMKSTFARGAAKITPAMGKFAKRAAVTFALLAARARGADTSAPARRTTAPARGGGLHAEGRRVVRSQPAIEAAAASPPIWRNRRALAIAGAAVCALVLVFFALRKSPPPQASAPPAVDTPAPQSSVPPAIPATTAAAAEPAPAAPTPQAPASSDHDTAPSPAIGEGDHGHTKPARVAPFGNGPVAHGNLLHIKMDGSIEKIEGASTPTGFTVVIPSRRSLEAAAPLAARDSRIAGMRITNEAHGAELAVTFKDGVPNYQVRAKGDTLEIALATSNPGAESGSPRPLTRPVANKTKRINGHSH